MSKGIAVVGVLLSMLSVLFVIIGLATTDWLKGCISFEDLFSSALGALDITDADAAVPNTSNTLEQVKQAYAGHNLCIALGLFQIGTDIGIGSSSIAVGIDSRETFIVATASLLIVGIIFLALGSLCAIIGAAPVKFSASKNAGIRLLKVGLTMHVIGTSALLAAMLVYTIRECEVLNSPLMFFAQVQTALMDALSDVFPSQFSPNPGSFPGNYGPPSDFGNQPDLGTLGASPGNVPDFGNNDFSNPGFGNPNFGNPNFGNPNLGNPDFGNPDFGNPEFGNPNLVNPEMVNPVFGSSGLGGDGNRGTPDMTQLIQSFFGGFVIKFGYSFILGWVAFASALIACLLDILAVLRLSTHSSMSDESYPMK